MSKPVVSTDLSSWKHVFRAYDIRGVYREDLTTEIAEIIGKAFGTYIGSGKKLVVSRDVRIGSEQLKKAVVEGLISSGSEVVDLGIATTPMFYFAVAHQNRDGGVMVTASHNPREWNGFKLCREKSIIVGEGSGIKEIEAIIAEGKFNEASVKGKIEPHTSIVEEYARFVLSKIALKKKLKVVLDTCNSVPGIVAPMLLRKIGCKVEVINERLDGTFPSRSPEPTEDSLQPLAKAVEEGNADFGIGYDGDGDRAVFVDDTGRILAGDLTSIIFAQAIITKRNEKVVFDVTCSSALGEAIEAKGGVNLIERVGPPFMRNRLLRENAVFGGERSGHFYFPEIYGLDDGTYASLKMAETVSRADVPLSRMIDQVPRFHSNTVNVPFSDEDKFNVILRVRAKFSMKGLSIIDIDGVKVQDNEGWVLLRPSNTEPLIRIFAEGKTQNKLAQMLELAKRTLNEEAKNIN